MHASMQFVARWLVGAVSPLRIAASVACGVALGCLPAGTPVWLVVLVLVIVFRTHIPTLVLAWCAGLALAWPLGAWYAGAGAAVLQAQPEFWRGIVRLPVICYLELHRSRVMGSLVCGLAAGILAGVVCLLVLAAWRMRHPVRMEAR